MKKLYFSFLMLFICITNGYSQLQVDSTGYVGVGITEEILEDEEADSIMSPFSVYTAGGNNSTVSLGNGNRPMTMSIFNVATGNAMSTGLNSSGYSSTGDVQGIVGLGMSIANTDNYVIGVEGITYLGKNAAGILGGPYFSPFNENFAGVYGSVTNRLPVFLYPGQYAGYFDGTVRVTGALYTQSLYLPSASYSGNNSKNSSVNSIMEVERITDKLRNVCVLELQHNKPIIAVQKPHYAEEILKGRDIKELSLDERYQLDTISNIAVPTETDPLSSVNYGLDAEQLRAMFPKLVQQDKEGNYSINYIEMIPLLVKSINELSEELEELKGTSRNMAKTQSETTGIDNSVSDVDMVRMDQNRPNPFSESTVIGLNIPEKAQKANIFIYDLSGKQVKNEQINERGETNITVYASELGAGMYIYTLVVDGKVVVTRRMIVIES